ncbi:type II toxin-antitoxin system RelE/ParE family toxin [Candidatus Nitrotoga sp. AM1P]
MYIAKFEEAIYVLHCFQKKAQGDQQAGQSYCRGALSRRG